MAPPKFMGLTGHPLSLAVSTVATTGFVLFGYDQGVMSGIITAPAFNNLFTATKGNSTMQGFVTAIYEIGKWEPILESDSLWNSCFSDTQPRLPLRCHIHPLFRRLPRPSTRYDHGRLYHDTWCTHPSHCGAEFNAAGSIHRRAYDNWRGQWHQYVYYTHLPGRVFANEQSRSPDMHRRRRDCFRDACGILD